MAVFNDPKRCARCVTPGRLFESVRFEPDRLALAGNAVHLCLVESGVLRLLNKIDHRLRSRYQAVLDADMRTSVGNREGTLACLATAAALVHAEIVADTVDIVQSFENVAR